MTMEATELDVRKTDGSVTRFYDDDGPFKVWWKDRTETPRLIVHWTNNDGDVVVNEFPARNVSGVRAVTESEEPSDE